MRISLILLVPSIALSCSTSPDQQTSANRSISNSDFFGKSFDVAIDRPDASSLKDVQVTAIFNKGTTALFRLRRGAQLVQKLFSWRLVGDSLRIKRVDVISKDSKFSSAYQALLELYSITKEQSGYLLKGKRDQMLLTFPK